VEDIFDAAWFEIIQAYSSLTKLNRPRDIPILKNNPSDQKKIPWEYEGRTWFWWLHVFSKNYGWTKDVVEELDIDEALSLLQEIQLEDQFQREWQWSLTEIAYPYDANTKKSQFKELGRPLWMQESRPFLPSTKVKFRKNMIPVGRVIGEDGNDRIVN
jgi:hypothetical protein